MDRLGKSDDSAITDIATLQHLAARQTWPINDDRTQRFASYQLALGKEAIQLGIIEFRILLFLASRPYHAFTRRSIADAVQFRATSSCRRYGGPTRRLVA